MNLFTDTFSYPFRQSGKYMLLIGAILNVIASICMFALMASARILGLVYRNKEEELNWL